MINKGYNAKYGYTCYEISWEKSTEKDRLTSHILDIIPISANVIRYLIVEYAGIILTKTQAHEQTIKYRNKRKKWDCYQ